MACNPGASIYWRNQSVETGLCNFRTTEGGVVQLVNWLALLFSLFVYFRASWHSLIWILQNLDPPQLCAWFLTCAESQR